MCICSQCDKDKEIIEFQIDNSESSGHRSECKICSKKKKIKYMENPQYRFLAYINSAKYRNISFHITLELFTEITVKPCKYCGLMSKGKAYCGIDRLNNGIGYIEGNIVPCCDICNWLKGELSYEEFMGEIKRIYEHNKLGG